MLTAEQYELLAPLADGKTVELKWPLPPEWENVKAYIYVVKTFDIMCSNGVKVLPWIWAVNASGLEELELYEKRNHKQPKGSAEPQKDKAQKITRKLGHIAEGVIIAVLGALLYYVLSKLLHFN